MKKDKIELHENHRCRMREKYRTAKDSLSDHELLEILLYNAIPRKNTNELAHRLCNHFGSLQGVFDADTEELMSVEGVGSSTAFFIKQIPYLWKRCQMNEKEGVLLDTISKIGAYLVSRFYGETKEVVYLLMLDNSARLIECRKLCEGSVTSSSVNPRSIAEIALSRKAPRILLAHNHPHGSAEPSDEDVSATRYLRRAFSMIDLVLEEHFVISGQEYCPILLYLQEQFRKKEEQSGGT